MEAMPQKNKKQDVILNTDTAKQMLSNIFEACEYEQNRVPMEVLESYSHYRRERHGLQKIIIILVFIAFLLLPLLFVTPRLITSWDADAPLGKPILRVAVESLLPVESVRASMGDLALDVYQDADGSYLIHPSKNGTLTVIVTLVNKQYMQTQVTVDSADSVPPELVSHELVDGNLKIVFWDESGSLDYPGIYAMDMSGRKLYPASWNEAEMSVLFAYPPDTNLNIFVSDKYGNHLQLVLSLG